VVARFAHSDRGITRYGHGDGVIGSSPSFPYHPITHHPTPITTI
jgi:hypothetical protein